MRTRVEVRLPDDVKLKQRSELEAFVDYCVLRVERELGERERWLAKLLRAPGEGYTCRVSSEHRGRRVDAMGTGSDGALAIWDAICQLEQLLRDRR